MRKGLITILIFLIVCSFSWAGFLTWDYLTTGSNWVPNTGAFGTGNDLFAIGGSINDDDWYSYGFNLRLDAPLWDLDAEIRGVTNRNWSVPMTEDEKNELLPILQDLGLRHMFRNRMDMLEVPFTLQLPVFKDEQFSFNFNSRIGYFFVGNLGFVEVQNANHRSRGIAEMKLKYISATWQGLMLGADTILASAYQLKVDGGIGLTLKLSDNLLIGYQNSFEFKSSFSIFNRSQSVISVGLGYDWIHRYTGNVTYVNAEGKEVHNDDILLHQLIAEGTSGPKLFLDFDFGFMTFDYYRTLNGTFGYGRLIFNVMDFFKPRTWNTTDVAFSYGKTWVNGINYQSICLSFPLGTQGLFLTLNDSFCDVTPLYYPNPDNMDNPSNITSGYYLRLERIGYLGLVGVMYQPDSSWSKHWVTPYVQLSAGFQMRKHRINANAWIYSLIEETDNPIWTSQSMPVLDLELGIYLLPEDFLVIKDTSLRLKALVGGTMGLWNNATEYDLDPYTNLYKTDKIIDAMKELTQFSWRASIAIVLGTDLK